ncbi:MAG: EAL domain-containing protein [Lachnospiraceae bacterium]|nr:EAL domain-containing protein [Lachnospiraceae bacterium]
MNEDFGEGYITTNYVKKLHNRNDFFEVADKIIKEIENDRYCLIAIDIEHFKLFNKWYGRKKGDEFLNQFAEILYYLEEEKQGVCGYFGGDNFVILMKYGSVEFIRVQEDLNQCALDIGKRIGFLPAYGIYKIKDKEGSSITMYDMALLALSQVKGNFDNRCCEFNESMTSTVEEELNVISEVRGALGREEFIFYAQPKCNISNGKIIGAEALVRWEHPTQGLISPGRFIPILEKNGFISDLDRYVWEMVCKWIRKIIDMGYKPIPISINVSRLDVVSMDVPEVLVDITEKYQIDHSLLRVEITESACIETTDTKIQGTVKRIQSAGFTVLMDDFGSGYSSLNMLKSVMIDVIKIDMKFLDISNDETQKGIGILESVVNMSNSMGIPIIVEGVETKKQEEFLLGMGCHFAQGYYYYKPMPISEFEKLLSDKDNIDYRGIYVNQSEQVHINELINVNDFSESQFNNILGAVSFFDMYKGKISITKVNDQYYNLLGTDVDYDITKARQLWENIFLKNKEYIMELFREAEDNQIKGSAGKLRFTKYDGTSVWLNIKLFMLKAEKERIQFIGLYSEVEENITQQNVDNLKISKINSIAIEDKIKIESLYGNLPCGFTIANIILDDKKMVKDFGVIYSNKESEKLFNCEFVKLKRLFKRIFGSKDEEKFKQMCKDVAYEGNSFSFEVFVEETGKYLRSVFFQYRYGFMAAITTDTTKTHIFDTIIKTKIKENTEFLYVDLEKDTFNLLYPENYSLVKYGKYSDVILKQLETEEVLYIDKKQLIDTLSVNGIRNVLKDKDNVELLFKCKDDDTFKWCKINLIVGERRCGTPGNVILIISKDSKGPIEDIISIDKKDTVLIVEKSDSDNSKLKNIFEKQYKVVSCNDLDSVNSILNRKCEQIILTIFEADSEQDEIYNIFKYYKNEGFVDKIPVIILCESSNRNCEFEDRVFNEGVSEIIYNSLPDNVISSRTAKVIEMFMDNLLTKQRYLGLVNEYNSLSDKFDIVSKLSKHNIWEYDFKNKELCMYNNNFNSELLKLSDKFNEEKVIINNFPDILSEKKFIDDENQQIFNDYIDSLWNNLKEKYYEIKLISQKGKDIWIGFWSKPIVDTSGKVDKLIGTYKVVTAKKQEILDMRDKIKIMEFMKIDSVKEMLVNLSRNIIVDYDDNSTKQWKEVLRKDKVRFTDIVKYVSEYQVSEEYKKQYLKFFNPSILINKYKGEPLIDSMEYQFYRKGKLITYKCYLCLMEIDTSGDIYIYIKYTDVE